ncbi:MAG: 2-C-methyl-D-erythritol 4-phosphate cytidylyltransferase [Planctomycetia bacterium]|nr:2-C-methyl-D-erythritol 4-phosphate cytidylyltransferase [Planctomycetia bacterium]
MSNFAVILPAAGKSSRFRDKNYKKPFVPLGGKPVWLYSVERFLARSEVKQVILVIAPEDREEFDRKFSANVTFLGIEVVAGGAERADSIQNGLARLKPEIEFVAVHDAARPCIADEWIGRVFAAAEKTDAAILGVPVASTLKRVTADGTIEETVSRANLWEAQTPQVFRKELLLEAYAKRAGFQATDDAQLVERLGRKVAVVAGSPINMKITTQDDLRFAEQAIKALPKPKNDFSNPFAGDDFFR